MSDTCQQCEREYQRIAKHWSANPDCSWPNLTQLQKDSVCGLLLGDGSIVGKDKKNAYLKVDMISQNYLKYLDDVFGFFSNGVKICATAENKARKNRETGFSPNAEAKDYSDLYRFRTIAHPQINEYADWYSSGKKVWPDDIKLTPTVLKHWYCGDGHWNNGGRKNCIEIAMSNEREHTDKVDKMFERVRLPSPSNYNVSKRPSGGFKCNAQFTVEQSERLWEYMGEPLPGFEYKWPDEYHKV